MNYESAKRVLRGVPTEGIVYVEDEDGEVIASVEHRQMWGSFIIRQDGKRQACGFYSAANFLRRFERDQCKVEKVYSSEARRAIA